MRRRFWPLAALLPFAAHHAEAHALAGARVFVPTLTMDDPGVADEATLPNLTWNGDSGVNSYDFGFEYDKTITEDLGFAINSGWNVTTQRGGKTLHGWDNVVVTGKYQTYVNPEHEFIFSAGIQREFGGTATLNTGGDRYGGTAPTLYMGKGFGDLPIGAFRALGVTGELAYSFPDKSLKATDDGFNLGNSKEWSGGFSVQYNMSYLKTQVRDYGLPDWANRMVPLVEITWTSPASAPSTTPTTYTVAPGVIYMADTWSAGIEALIPANRATGPHVGVVAQFHIFLDDMFPGPATRPFF